MLATSHLPVMPLDALAIDVMMEESCYVLVLLLGIEVGRSLITWIEG